MRREGKKWTKELFSIMEEASTLPSEIEENGRQIKVRIFNNSSVDSI